MARTELGIAGVEHLLERETQIASLHLDPKVPSLNRDRYFRTTVERFGEVMPVLSALSVAAERVVMSPDKRVQRVAYSAFQTIEGLFKSNGWTTKLLFPLDLVPSDYSVYAEGVEELYRKLAQDREEMRKRGFAPGEYIEELIRETGRGLSQNRRDLVNEIIDIVPARVKEDERYFEAHRRREELCYHIEETFMQVDMSAEERARIPLTVVKELQALAQLRLKGVPDVYSTRFKGVSVQSLMEERDPERFLMKAFTLGSNMPGGDYFWQRVWSGLLLGRLIPEGTTDPFFMHRFNFQAVLAELVLIPTLTGERAPAAFEREYETLMNRLDNDNLALIAMDMFSYATAGYYMYNTLVPGSSITDALTELPLPGYVWVQKRDQAITLEAVLYEFLHEHLDELVEGMKKRFPNNTNVHFLADRFAEGVRGFDFAETKTKAIEEGVAAWFGKEYAAAIEEIEPHLRKVKNVDPGELESTKQAGEYVFPKESPIEMMGFNSIHFDLLEKGAVRFFLNITLGDTVVTGWVRDGRVIVTPFSDKEAYSHLRNVIEQVVEKSYERLQNDPTTLSEVATGDAIADAHSTLAEFLKGEKQ